MQPGSVTERFQLTDSRTGTPRLSSAARLESPLAQSEDSQMTRPADITTMSSLAGPISKAQDCAPVETAYRPNCGSWPPRYSDLLVNRLSTTALGEQSPFGSLS